MLGPTELKRRAVEEAVEPEPMKSWFQEEAEEPTPMDHSSQEELISLAEVVVLGPD
jgi:hypothetical protein